YARMEVPDQPARSAARLSLRSQVAAFVAPLRDVPEFRRYMLINVPCRLGQYLPIGLYSVFWVRELGATDAFIGWRTTVASLALTAGYFGWGKVAVRKGHLRVLLLCAAGLALYPILTALT